MLRDQLGIFRLGDSAAHFLPTRHKLPESLAWLLSRQVSLLRLVALRVECLRLGGPDVVACARARLHAWLVG